MIEAVKFLLPPLVIILLFTSWVVAVMVSVPVAPIVEHRNMIYRQ